jgi:outer membrane protein OmpA-like peptidoglycan-associated protein
MPTDGSSKALKKLQSGKADAAVLWEPDVTRALSAGGMVKLVGTEDTDKLIVDILLAGREFASRKPGAVRDLLDAWFETLQLYQSDNSKLIDDIRKETDLEGAQIDSMLDGVQWSGLLENGTLWFDVQQQNRIGSDGLVEAIEAAAEILVENGDFSSSPVPGSDPYRLTSREFVKQLYLETYPGGSDVSQENSLSRDFKPLTESQWKLMRRVGTLKVEPVSFRRGTGLLDLDGKNTIDRIAEKVRRYPNFRILVEGHTGLKGDPEQNLKLSASRAQAVARYLMVTYKIDSDRVRALGYGASKPLAKKPGESSRAYSYRLPRVEISLLSGGR